MAIHPPPCGPIQTFTCQLLTRAHLIAAIRSLLAAGMTARDVADLFRAHPRAIEVLLVT